MRKTIIIALLLIVSSFAFSQTKTTGTDTAKRSAKQFEANLERVVDVKIKLPLYQIDNYVYTLQNPNYANSDLSGKRINGITVNAQAALKTIVDSLVSAYNKEIALQQKAFINTSKTKSDKTKQ